MTLLGAALSYSIQVAVVAGVGLLLVRTMGRAGPQARLLTLQATAALALLAPFAPLPSVAVPVVVAGEEVWVQSANAMGVATAGVATWVAPAVLALFAAGVVWRLMTMVVSLVSLRRARRAGKLIDHADDSLATGVDRVSSRARAWLSPLATVPMTYGLVRPTILLPESFVELPKPQQRAVLCHEQLHIARRDWLVGLVEEAVRTVLWFHPLVHLMLARISAFREQVVDRAVVARCGERRVYLEALLSVARARSSAIDGARPAAAFVRRRELVERIRVLKQEEAMTGTRFAVQAAAAAVVLVGAAVLTTGLFPVSANAALVAATSEQEEAEEGAPIFVTGDVQRPVKIHTVQPAYTDIAKEAKIQGHVILQAVINRRGDIERVKILKGLPMGLTDNAIQAVEQWKYEPATLDGKPVAVYFNVTINFNLRECSEEGSDCPEPDAG